jgi:hypothetical protein
MSNTSRQRRKAEVAQRAATPDHMYSYCRIIGCRNPTTVGEGKGLNRLYCRKHEDHYQRHGSYTKPSYPASVTTPLRKVALKWITENEDQRTVQLAIEAVRGLYRRAGPYVEAYRLAGLSPEQRAKAAWARLREAKVDPRKPLAAWLAVELAVSRDLQPETKPAFKRVQAAKLVHRMASGSHKRWEREQRDGTLVTQEMHKYPASRGRVLWHIGEQLERATELVTPDFLDNQNNSRELSIWTLVDSPSILCPHQDEVTGLRR